MKYISYNINKFYISTSAISKQSSHYQYLFQCSGFIHLHSVDRSHFIISKEGIFSCDELIFTNWSISNTMTAEWCKQVVEEALQNHGKPEIFNTDQGSQFTSEAFTGLLSDNDIQISMDGKGRAIDNIFVERLWRSVKYEHIYLHTPKDGIELYEGLRHYFHFYNSERLHQSLNYQKPEVLYKKAAA